MGTRTLTLELPDDLFALLGPPETAAARAKEALVLELLREVRISQGQAARFLDLSRRDIIQLMADHDVPSGPLSAEDVDRELEAIQRYSRDRKSRERGGGQQQ